MELSHFFIFFYLVFFFFKGLDCKSPRQHIYAFKHIRGNSFNSKFEVDNPGGYSRGNWPGALSGASFLKAAPNLLVLSFGEQQNVTDDSNRIWHYDVTREEFRLVRGHNPNDPTSDAPHSTFSDSENAFTYSPENMPSIRSFHCGVEMSLGEGGEHFLFGGRGPFVSPQFRGGDFNDLWIYSWEREQFRFAKGNRTRFGPGFSIGLGLFHEYNVPSARQRLSGLFVDVLGEVVVMFGKTDTYDLNEVWFYNPVLNQFRWVHGDWDKQGEMSLIDGGTSFHENNKPRGRYGASLWFGKSKDEIFTYGGTTLSEGGIDYKLLGDLWSYSISLNQFKLVFGTTVPDDSTPSKLSYEFHPDNTPSTRYGYFVFAPPGIGEFAIASGTGRYAFLRYYLDDMYVYSFDKNQFRMTHEHQGVPETIYGNFTEDAMLGGRRYVASTLLQDDLMIIYGGFGTLNSPDDGIIGDLWYLARLPVCSGGFHKHDPRACSSRGNGACVFKAPRSSQVSECRCTTKFTGSNCEKRVSKIVALSIFLPLLSLCIILCVLLCGVFCALFLLCFKLDGGKRRRRTALEKVVNTIPEEPLKDAVNAIPLQISDISGVDGDSRLSTALDLALCTVQVHDDYDFNFDESLLNVDPEQIRLGRLLNPQRGTKDAEVWRCEYFSMDVVFKCYSLEQIGTQEKMNRIENEIRLLKRITHPFCIQYIGCCKKGGMFGSLMEHALHGTMKNFVMAYRNSHTGSSYPLHEKLRMLEEVSTGMNYLHLRKIMHRDLKPGNVFINESYTCKISDFGLSRRITGKEGEKRLSFQIGTGIFISPEMIKCEQYNFKTDVFSFSMLAYVFVTENNTPYGPTHSGNELLFKVSADPKFRPDAEKIGNEVLRNVIVRCWDHDASKRMDFGEISALLKNEVSRVKITTFEE